MLVTNKDFERHLSPLHWDTSDSAQLYVCIFIDHTFVCKDASKEKVLQCLTQALFTLLHLRRRCLLHTCPLNWTCTTVLRLLIVHIIQTPYSFSSFLSWYLFIAFFQSIYRVFLLFFQFTDVWPQLVAFISWWFWVHAMHLKVQRLIMASLFLMVRWLLSPWGVFLRSYLRTLLLLLLERVRL